MNRCMCIYVECRSIYNPAAFVILLERKNVLNAASVLVIGEGTMYNRVGELARMTCKKQMFF